jgi:hypothetical protein
LLIALWQNQSRRLASSPIHYDAVQPCPKAYDAARAAMLKAAANGFPRPEA